MTALKPQLDGVGVGQDVGQMLTAAGVIGLWKYDIRTGLVTGDEAMALSYRLDPEDVRRGLSPRHFRNAIHPLDLGAAVSALNEAIKYGTDYRARYRLQDGEGYWKMVSVRGRVHRTKDGELSSIVGLNRLAEDDGDTEPLNRMALLATELLQLSRNTEDEQAHYLSQTLLIHVSRALAARIGSI